MKDYEEYYTKHEQEIFDDYFSYLKFPSISAQKIHEEDLYACADWLEKKLSTIGFKTERWEGSGYPTIFGEKFHKDGAPTLLFYGHYDVQPPEPLELWNSPPFSPTIRDGYVYARGAEDNKGQNWYVISAIKAFLEKHETPNVNLKILIEGEEEMGSTTLSEILPKYRDRLQSDYLLIVDMGMGSFESPAVTLSARGIMTMEVKVSCMNTDAHSGALGGITYNPNRALVEVLGKAVNEKGQVAIDGFYDQVKELSSEEKELIDTTFDGALHREEVGLKVFHNEDGYNPTEANYFRPTFEINGIWGGYTGDGFKTVIPKEASAKISTRLVPDQDPDEVFALVSDFFRKNLPEGMEVTFHSHGGGKAAWGSPNSRVATILKKAYEDVLGKCSFIFGGGSIPITTDLAKYSGAEFVLPGMGLDSDNIHAPNEKFSLRQFRSGFLIIARTLELFHES